MREPAADLAIAVAIVSGYHGVPVPRDLVVIGEVGAGARRSRARSAQPAL